MLVRMHLDGATCLTIGLLHLHMQNHNIIMTHLEYIAYLGASLMTMKRPRACLLGVYLKASCGNVYHPCTVLGRLLP